MQEITQSLFHAVAVIVIPALAAYIVAKLKAWEVAAKEKAQSELAAKYLDEAADAVSTAVLCVAQTYTDKLKESGAFSAENKKEAFDMAVSKAQSLLPANVEQFLNETYSDLNEYLTTRIEAEVKLLK